MHFDVARHRWSWVPLFGVALLGLLAQETRAAGPYYYGWPNQYQYGQAAYYPGWDYPAYAMNPYQRPAYGYYPTAYQPNTYGPVASGYPNNCNQAPCTQVPVYQQAPAYPQAPGRPMPPAQPMPPAAQPRLPEAAPAAPAQAQQPPMDTPTDQVAQSPETGQELGGAGTAFSATSYIDSAIPRTTVRVRADAAFRNIRPDRAEFFYAKCGCFRTAPAPFTDPTAPGPPRSETRVDYQEIQSYLEYAPTNRVSGFIEVPVRMNEFAQNIDEQGLGDINFGFKAAVIAQCNTFLTIQVKTYVPSGAASQGLGTHHVSVEPGILFYQGIGERARIEGEVRDWAPFVGTDFSGNVLRYGLGASYDVWKNCKWRLAPVVECVGWSVMNGKESDGNTGTIQSSGGETIVNVKGGLRLSTDHVSISASYGRALTGDFWYKDIGRLEMKWMY